MTDSLSEKRAPASYLRTSQCALASGQRTDFQSCLQIVRPDGKEVTSFY